jgi:hypothetical protein
MSMRSILPTILILGVALVPAGSPARAADRDLAGLRGYVDGSVFGSLAGEDSQLVEIHLGPAILGAIARGASNDPESAALLGGLRAVSAYIVGLEGDPDRARKAAKLVHDMEQRLLRDGWEHLARVRDKGDKVIVLVLGGDGTVEGLVVLVLDKDGGQVVFANLAGTLDLAKIDRLHETLDVPGLDELGEKDRGAAPGAHDRKKKEQKPHGERREEEAR